MTEELGLPSRSDGVVRELRWVRARKPGSPRGAERERIDPALQASMNALVPEVSPKLLVRHGRPDANGAALEP